MKICEKCGAKINVAIILFDPLTGIAISLCEKCANKEVGKFEVEVKEDE